MRSPGRVLTVLAVVAAAIGVPASGRAAPTGRPAAAHAVSAAPSDPPADFNGDGYGDLAVGVPGESIGSVEEAGAVNVIYGSSAGLTAAGNELLSQGCCGGIQGTAEAGDDFGFALAWADFNGDGYSDLAVGVPGEDIFFAGADAGAVNVIYGSPAGLTAAGNQILYQGCCGGIAGTAEAGDQFGAALAGANFGHSSRADLAVGVVGEDVGSVVDAGAVNVIYGSSTGLTATGNHLIYEGVYAVGRPEAGDQFGWSLAGADFGNSSQADLAVGIPAEDIGSAEDAGAVDVVYGSSTGLTATGSQAFYQGCCGGIKGKAEGEVGPFDLADGFGWALAAANFGNSSQADLAVGVPFEDIEFFPFASILDAGAVNVIYGSSTGLTAAGNQMFWQGCCGGIRGTAEEDDEFGGALAAANFGNTTYADLAVGVEGESIGSVLGAGAVNVIYGSSGGLTAAGNQIFWQGCCGGIKGEAEVCDYFGEAIGPGGLLLFGGPNLSCDWDLRGPSRARA